MTNSNKKASDLWVWIIIGLIVATIAVASLYYIGWFDTNSHVDTPAGDNVMQQYTIETPDAPVKPTGRTPDMKVFVKL